jgi:hypothetical protein
MGVALFIWFPLASCRIGKTRHPRSGDDNCGAGVVATGEPGAKAKKNLSLINKLFQIVSEAMQFAVGDIPHYRGKRPDFIGLLSPNAGGLAKMYRLGRK